ncbi:hypothetical protein SAMN04488587_1636 [Methanococcoides vulcani]|uniref:Uncharacterized protein n=1 Tax=Methanococcoides vulcani TaxID=1353158 RepID=A0A1I0AFN3_9EURY|nr:hypothetical protein SAMN04488587_1636 [Methanococcoides vulcani]
MPTSHIHPFIWGAMTFILAIPITYFMFNEIKWKFALCTAIGTMIGAFIGSLL